MAKKITKAIFPVGGLGTRFLPATKSMPKEMLPILDKPLIQYAVEEALEAGVEQLIFITGRGKGAIEDHFDRSLDLEEHLEKSGKEALAQTLKNLSLEPGRIIYTRQQQPLGLGHAVLCARRWVADEPFAVLLADDFVLPISGQAKPLEQMGQHYDFNASPMMAAVLKVKPQETSSYGILDVADVQEPLVKARGLVEKPPMDLAPSPYAIIGRYLLPYDLFDALEKQGADRRGEIQLTDAMCALLAQQAKAFQGFLFQGDRYDCGHQAGWLAANLATALSRADLKETTTALINTMNQRPSYEQKITEIKRRA